MGITGHSSALICMCHALGALVPNIHKHKNGVRLPSDGEGSLIDLTYRIFLKLMYQFPGTGFSETDSFHFLPEGQATQRGCM